MSTSRENLGGDYHCRSAPRLILDLLAHVRTVRTRRGRPPDARHLQLPGRVVA